MFLVYFIAQYLTYNTLTYNYYYKTIFFFIKFTILKIINYIFCHNQLQTALFVSCLVFILVDSSASSEISFIGILNIQIVY